MNRYGVLTRPFYWLPAGTWIEIFAEYGRESFYRARTFRAGRTDGGKFPVHYNEGGADYGVISADWVEEV